MRRSIPHTLFFFLIYLSIWPLDAFSQTFIGGPIFQDKTLYKEIEPYIVADDIIITSGNTLFIEPGVRVLFEPETSISGQGNIYAVGTANDSIYFGPRNEGTEWHGISLIAPQNGSSGSSQFAYCEIKGSYYDALAVSDRINVSINHCYFHNNPIRSIKLFDCDNSEIRNNIIRGSNYGLYINSHHDTRNNVIDRNNIDDADVGIFLNWVDTISINNTVSHNYIYNSGKGIQIDGGDPSQPYENIVWANKLYNNETGILIYNARNTITKNALYGNTEAVKVYGDEYEGGKGNHFKSNIFLDNEYGLMFDDKCYTNQIDSNQFLFNREALIMGAGTSSDGQSNVIRYNLFRNNAEFAVRLNDAPQAEISYNNFIESDTSMFMLMHEQDQEAPNNWWGTYIAQEIDRRIYDRNDDPQYGEVKYIPFLVSPSVDMLSPPQKPRKQLAGDTVLVSWDIPADGDVSGFKVYYDNLDGYRYKEVIDAGHTDSITIAGWDIKKEIAVTSYHREADDTTDQQEFLESWFVEALAYPYAGTSHEICEGEVLSMNEATAYEYDSIRWETNGRGQIVEPQKVNTAYIHSDEDVNKTITFWIHLYDSTVLRKDSMNIRIHPLAEVFAGQDTTILVDSSLQLEDAYVNFADSIRWSTTGDGSYQNPHAIDADYTPGQNDMNQQSAELILKAFSKCGTVTDTVRLRIEPTFQMSGNVQGEQEVKGRVELYEAQGDRFSRKGGALINGESQFKFSLVTRGKYYLLFIPRNNGQYFPTYYVESCYWLDAHALEIKAPTYDLDIQPQPYKYKLPEGEGAINGTISFDNEILQARSIIYLTDTSLNLLDWAMPDNYGEFYFDNLPYGNYRLRVERIGMKSAVSAIITLSPDYPAATNIQITPDGKDFDISGEVENQKAFLVYPTLVKNYLHVIHPVISGHLRWEIYDVRGNLMDKGIFSGGDNDNPNQINVSGLSKGMYFIKLSEGRKSVNIRKIIKM